MSFTDSVPKGISMTNPYFGDVASNLNKVLRNFSKSELKNEMNISNKLVNNVYRIINGFTGEKKYGRHALFAYRGAAFKAMDPLSLNEAQLSFAQNYFRILSAFYGVLRPFDSIEEYRLDMKIKLRKLEPSNLYSYWKNPLINYFNKLETSETIINLASNEFSQAIDFSQLKNRVIDILFGEMESGKIKSPPMYSKMARGNFAGYIVRNLITEPEHTKKFNCNGYSFNTDLSKCNKFIFTRS